MRFGHDHEPEVDLEARRREELRLSEGLAPLRELRPPAELRVRNRRRIQAMLEELRIGNRLARRTPWWRRRMTLPWPVAVCAAALVVGLIGLDARRWLEGPAAGPPTDVQSGQAGAGMEMNGTKASEATALGAAWWRMEASPVIVDGGRLIGRVTYRGGAGFVVIAPGVGRWEVAAGPFEGALPAGRIENGVLRAGDLEIFGVGSGLAEGATVWVRRSREAGSGGGKGGPVRIEPAGAIR
ncbi:MAG TPA: hypothetical protein PK847_08625 [Candidatus Sumerlaeota bacterium]|nr:hypothetical protein [Candidatus Sumerlaeota bacterium]